MSLPNTSSDSPSLNPLIGEPAASWISILTLPTADVR